MRTFVVIACLLVLQAAFAQTERKKLPDFSRGRGKQQPVVPRTETDTAPVIIEEKGDTTNEQNSENGWYLSPHGTIRILVLFAEVEYDRNPQKDPQPNGSDHWPKGQLPKW